jgi:phosphohistidine phosphatase
VLQTRAKRCLEAQPMNENGKTVLLLRHGKSDWDAIAMGDHARPLARRGVAAARRVGEWLAEIGLEPDLVLTSDAVRALTTVELAAEAGRWSCPIALRPDFYGGHPSTLVKELRGLDAGLSTVLLAGHQPTWSQTVAHLSGGGNVRFPTAALACLVHPGEWPEIAAGSCALSWLVTPRLLHREARASG